MDINFWKTLPRHTCLTLFLFVNNVKRKVYCKYFHSTLDEVYCSYNFEENNLDNDCVSFLIFDNEDVVLNVDDFEICEGTILTSIKIQNINKTNEQPLIFSIINKKYINTINTHYKQLHLAHNYMDQGWENIINGNDLEHLYTDEPLFSIEDENVSLFGGEGLWINNECLPKLEELYKKSY